MFIIAAFAVAIFACRAAIIIKREACRAW